MKYLRGFTVVELVVVITAIAILAGIGMVSYSGMQVRARDNERKADAESMQAAVETYYEQKGEYPAFITTPASAELGLVPDFYTNTLRIPPSALVIPGAASGTTFSWGWGQTANNSNQYMLQSLHADGTPCIDTAPCTRYIIKWWRESDSTQQEIRSKFGN